MTIKRRLMNKSKFLGCFNHEMLHTLQIQIVNFQIVISTPAFNIKQ